MARKKRGTPILYRFRCTGCGLRFRAKIYEDDPDPPCPNADCGTVQTPIGLDVAAGKAPGIGGNALVKSMDQTADMVMQDYGMTDLHSARHGESMAPKLPPNQQARADAMFDPKKRAEAMGGGNPLLAAAMSQIVAGGIAAAGNQNQGGIDPIGAIHSQRYKPPVRLLTDKSG